MSKAERARQNFFAATNLQKARTISHIAGNVARGEQFASACEQVSEEDTL
jgi:hypothetical protein